MTMTPELRHTIRAVPWAVVLTPVVFGLGLAGMLHLIDHGATPTVAAGIVGSLAATVALALDDPAHALLDPLPIGPRRRAGLRIVLVVPLAAAAVAGFGALDGGLSARTTIASLLALSATAIAVVAVARPTRPDAAPNIGAGVALGWALGATLVTHGVLADAATLWFRHPWFVVLAAGIVFLRASRRTC